MFFWWIILVISVVAFVFLTGYIFPKFFLASGSGGLTACDRGLRNFKEKNGRSIVYEPAPKYRKYISQYVLSFRQGEKALVCKLKENFAFLDYDIVVFNCYNRSFKTINVKENIKTPGFTRLVKLPKQTAYISLIINFADNIDVKKEAEPALSADAQKSDQTVAEGLRQKRIPDHKNKPWFYIRPIVYALTTVALIVLEVFFIKLALGNIFGDVFWEDFMSRPASIVATLITGFIVAAAAVALAAVYLIIKKRKQRNNF